MGEGLEEWDLFRREVEKLGVPLDDLAIGRFRKYLEELREWNERVRLVGSSHCRDVMWLHFYDSLTVLPLLGEARRIVDVGSGAGFPGLPLKIANCDLEVALVEARRRRANFLRHMVRVLGLKDVSVVEGRIEGIGCLGEWEVAIARGVAPGGEWIRWVEPFLGRKGRAILMMGQKVEMNLEERLGQWGWMVLGERRLEIPVVRRKRRLLVVQRRECFT